MIKKKNTIYLYAHYQLIQYTLILICLFGWLTVKAQTIDSAKTDCQNLAAEQFPPIQAFQVQYESFGNKNFSSKLYHQPFQHGAIENERRLTVDAGIPLYIKPKYIVTAALRYSSNQMRFSKVAVTNPNQTSIQQTVQQNLQYFSATESIVYFASLFQKPAIYNANLIIDGNQNGIQRAYGFVTTTLVLKNSQYTTISIGVIGFIDPAAVIPAAPILGMRLSFVHSAWWVDCMLPRYILFKRPLYRTARLSLGSELNSNIFYVNPSAVAPSDTYQFNQFEVNTGATYEQHLNKHFILSLRGGFQHTLFAQLAPINKSLSDDLYQTKPNGTRYYTIGLSYNIFKQKPKGS